MYSLTVLLLLPFGEFFLNLEQTLQLPSSSLAVTAFLTGPAECVTRAGMEKGRLQE